MKRAIALACALGALAWAPAAFAGTPFTIGSGTSPHLLVDPTSGDAHVVWLQGPSGGQTVAYCRVPRGARSCAGPVQDLGSPPGGTPDLPHIVRAANGTLYVTQHRYVYDDAHLKESTNGGASFDPAWRPVYSGANWSGPSQPTFHNQGSQLLFPSWNTGLRVYAANISGNQSGDTAEAELPVPGEVSNIYNFGVGQPNATSLVGTADSNENLYLWRLTGGNVNSTASWTQTPELLGEGRESNLASGPRGAFVVSTAGPVGAYRTEVRRITSAGVVGPTVVENTGGTLADLAVGQNGVGVAYRGENRLRFALSTDDGGSFPAPYNIAPFDGSAYFSLDVGVANDNQGFAVWNGDAEDNTSIRLTTLEPFVDPVVQPPPPQNPGNNQPPVRSQPQSPNRTSTANIPGVPGGRIALQTPRSCVRPGARFNTTLTLQMKRSKTKKKKSGQGRLKVKLSRVDFFIGAKKVKTDKKAPFRQTLRVAQSARPGSTITVRARATIKVKPGSKKRTKSVKTNVSAGVGVC